MWNVYYKCNGCDRLIPVAKALDIKILSYVVMEDETVLVCSNCKHKTKTKLIPGN